MFKMQKHNSITLKFDTHQGRIKASYMLSLVQIQSTFTELRMII